MAKKSQVARQLKRERMVKNKWEKRKALKETILDMSKNIEERLAALRSAAPLCRFFSPREARIPLRRLRKAVEAYRTMEL